MLFYSGDAKHIQFYVLSVMLILNSFSIQFIQFGLKDPFKKLSLQTICWKRVKIKQFCYRYFFSFIVSYFLFALQKDPLKHYRKYFPLRYLLLKYYMSTHWWETFSIYMSTSVNDFPVNIFRSWFYYMFCRVICNIK